MAKLPAKGARKGNEETLDAPKSRKTLNELLTSPTRGAAKEPKTKAFPKSMGACADLLYSLRQKRLDLDKLAAAAKAEEQRLIDHIVDTLPKEDTGAAGKTHRVQVITKQKPQVKDWPAFYAYVNKNKAFELLQRRLSEAAIQERLDDPKNKKGLPGVEMFNAVTVSLTKVK